ncbi:hypothetical protein Pfo_001293 [Paulownia fortunei]|nr:hypothetical protein Pfo_001293 [Paulownia fortunei]
MGRRKKRPQRFEESLSFENLFAEMGIPEYQKKKFPLVKEEPSLKDLKKQEDMSNAKPTVLVDRETSINGEDRFRIMHPIGTASSGSLPVYKAAHIAEHYVTYEGMLVQDVFVAVKIISTDQDPEAFMNLKKEVDNNGLIPDHQNLVGIREPFFYRGYFCVVFPFMELGSLRSIMATRFPDGVPEDCMLVVLKETLTGLSIIHGNGHVHGEISAGHIFFNGKPEIKLAFSASIYDLDTDQHHSSSSSYLPVASICNWAAAPEVHESDNNEYTPKADIWLIGITALELAYGGLRLMNREALDSMVMKINKKKRLPKKEGDLKTEANLCYGLSCLHQAQFKKRTFSKGFENMVVKCLALDPEKRPTADELLQYEIFTNSNKDVFYFHNLLKNT